MSNRRSKSSKGRRPQGQRKTSRHKTSRCNVTGASIVHTAVLDAWGNGTMTQGAVVASLRYVLAALTEVEEDFRDAQLAIWRTSGPDGRVDRSRNDVLPCLAAISANYAWLAGQHQVLSTRGRALPSADTDEGRQVHADLSRKIKELAASLVSTILLKALDSEGADPAEIPGSSGCCTGSLRLILAIVNDDPDAEKETMEALDKYQPNEVAWHLVSIAADMARIMVFNEIGRKTTTLAPGRWLPETVPPAVAREAENFVARDLAAEIRNGSN